MAAGARGGRDQRAPMERIIGFMALLHHARSTGAPGVPATELLRSAGWEEAGDGITALNRDLKALRTLGWRIENISAKGLPAVFRMTSVDNRLKLRLTPGQQAALRRAVLVADRADLADQLDLPADAAPAPLAAVALDDSPELTAVVTALRSGARLRFRYSGADRLVHPASLRTQQGAWYLRANEEGSSVVKRFVVGRMSHVEVDVPGSASPVTDDVPESLHPLAWEIDEPVDVTLRTPPEYADDVRRWLGEPQSVTTSVSPGGEELLLTYRVTHRAAMRSRIYQLGTRVRVAGPAEFRDELIAELATMAGE